MKWEGNRQSDNVEDRRSGGSGFGGGGMLGGRSIGIGTIVVALIGGWVLGINPLTLLGVLSGGSPAQVQQQQAPAQRPEPATILFFTGVRYERMPDPALPAPRQRRRS